MRAFYLCRYHLLTEQAVVYVWHFYTVKRINTYVLLDIYDCFHPKRYKKKRLFDFPSDSGLPQTQVNEQRNALTSTEFNQGHTQYESLTENLTTDVSPRQG